MKAIYNLSAALAVLLLTACGNDEIIESNENGTGERVSMTFTANAPAADTRTSLVEGAQVYWTPGDVIGVYSCIYQKFEVQEPGSPFTTDLAADAPTATFTGTAELGALQYIAVYPQDKFMACEWNSESTALWFTLPTEQQAVAGGFASGLNLSWATTAEMGGDLTFKNLCALVKFSISGGEAGDLKSVTLTDLGGTGISGTMMYMNAQSMGEFVMAEISFPSVTLTGTFTTGTDYYFVVAPSVDTNNYAPAALKKGFSLTFTRQDGTSFTKTASNGIGDNTNLTAGMILNLGSIDLSGATYQDAITNTLFINMVGDQVDWEVTDGIVLLTEKNKQAIAKVTSLNIDGKSLTDISGIEYFTNLTSLYCSDNRLTELPVENLTNLTSLYCSDNRLTELPVENLTNLTSLDCFNNQLTALPVENLTKLTSLNCSYNQLTVLPVENLTNLTSLYCSDNQLTELPVENLTNLTSLDCFNNQLTALPVENLTQLRELICGGSQLTALSVANLPQLIALHCHRNQIQSLSVEGLSNLQTLACHENQLTELDISSLTELKNLFCGNQTNAAGELQDLKLLLASAQEETWETYWYRYEDNKGVTVEYDDELQGGDATGSW